MPHTLLFTSVSASSEGCECHCKYKKLRLQWCSRSLRHCPWTTKSLVQVQYRLDPFLHVIHHLSALSFHCWLSNKGIKTTPQNTFMKPKWGPIFPFKTTNYIMSELRKHSPLKFSSFLSYHCTSEFANSSTMYCKLKFGKIQIGYTENTKGHIHYKPHLHNKANGIALMETAYIQ